MTQATYNSHGTSGLGIVERIRVAVNEWRAYRRARSSLHELQQLDDRMLADIGICQDDLTWADYLPTSRNPISELARCRQKNIRAATLARTPRRRKSGTID